MEIIQGISGINFCVNEEYINKNIKWFLKDKSCSTLKIGNFYMLYISEAAISPTLPFIDSVTEIIAKLFHFGFLDFETTLRFNYEKLLIWIKSHFFSILKLSEIRVFWDYPEYVLQDNQHLSRFETRVMRNNSVWCIYDKRVFLPRHIYSSPYFQMLNPFRQELHLTLKNCEYLYSNLLLFMTPSTFFDQFRLYIIKSWRRWSYKGLLKLPKEYTYEGRIGNTYLPTAHNMLYACRKNEISAKYYNNDGNSLSEIFVDSIRLG